LAGIRFATWLTAAALASASFNFASAQQQQNMLPPSGGGFGLPSIAGDARSLPQQQSLAPLYAPPPTSSPSMPIPSMIAAPPAMPVPGLGGRGSAAQQATLSLTARFGSGRDAPLINSGLVWRVFPATPEANGTFRLLKEDKTPNPVLPLPAGNYVVHVTCGMASLAKAVHVENTTREVFELPAGGIKLEGRVGDARIPPTAVTFDIFQGSQFDSTSTAAKTPSKTAMVQGVVTGDVVVVPEGNYYIVSNYGDSNAVVRSDIRVQTGKLTEVTVSHRAALVSLKLVSEKGGDAIANTNWSIITSPGGDVVKESAGIFPRVVLAEGDYRAIARNEGRTFEREFKVVTGVDGEIEVLARQNAPQLSGLTPDAQ
jgi:hypothetical protein